MQQPTQTPADAGGNPGDGRPILAITMGDAAGIGPEIIVKTLAHAEVQETCRPIVVGDVAVMDRHLRFWPQRPGAVQPTVVRVDSPEEARWRPDTINVLQPGPALGVVEPGRLSAEAGRGAAAYVKAAAGLARERRVHGIVTAPINKEALQLAGLRYPGHTELLAEEFGVTRYSLVLSARGLFIFHVTTHVSLRQALELITRDRVLGQIRLAHALAVALGQPSETVAVAGVNPHAGEGGLFGTEEQDIIGPAVVAARAEGIPAVGPLPADVVFPKAVRGEWRFVVAMYHDQGHAVFKSLFFDEGVNVTVGLPVIRTSVDHGTAFDIAGQGVAREDSLVHAVALAARLGPAWDRVWQLVARTG